MWFWSADSVEQELFDLYAPALRTLGVNFNDEQLQETLEAARFNFSLLTGRIFDLATIASCDHFSALVTGATEQVPSSTALTSHPKLNFQLTTKWDYPVLPAPVFD